MIGDAIVKVLNNQQYNSTSVGNWSNKICDDVVNQLKAHNENFKYIVTCAISERGELCIDSANYYSSFDATMLVTWENESMQVVVNAFAVSL